MISKIKSFFAKQKFNNDLAAITKRCNEQYKSEYRIVTCEYCRGRLLNEDATIVYDIERGMAEYSHDECWEKNNEHGLEPIVPLK